jgi:hypothetical protein
MTVKEAKQQLAFYRQQQRTLRRQIEELRRFLLKKGVDPDPPKVDLSARNKAIYGLYLDGKSYSEAAHEYKLTPARIKDLCRREEAKQARAARRNQTEE